MTLVAMHLDDTRNIAQTFFLRESIWDACSARELAAWCHWFPTIFLLLRYAEVCHLEGSIYM